MLFAVVGAPGVMAIDLLTFGVAVVVILLIQIPARPSRRKGARWPGRCGRKRRSAFATCGRANPAGDDGAHLLINFLITGAMVLNTPYILRITGSEGCSAP